MKKFNCIIVDDDEIDRLTVLSYVKKVDTINVIGVFDTAKEALDCIAKNAIDILFLDIDMPESSGLELRKQALTVPVCVFITAHPEHAVESFELNALDFIVKPIHANRFLQTINRINEFMDIKHKASLFETTIGDDIIFIKEGHQQTKIKLHDVLYLEALKDYTIIVTPQKRHCVLNSIGNLLKEPHFKLFIRVHRSYAIQKLAVQKITTNEVELINKMLIPIGRSYKDNLQLLV